MKVFVIALLSLCCSFSVFAQADTVSTEILTPEQMEQQPNYYLDDLQAVSAPNDKGEVKLYTYNNASGDYVKEDVWVNPMEVYQLYVISVPVQGTGKEFPVEIFSFPKLQTLVLPMWQFKSIPDNLANSLPKLTYIDLQGTPVTTLPETLKDLKYLENINLSGTSVAPAEVENLKKLLPKVTFF